MSIDSLANDTTRGRDMSQSGNQSGTSTFGGCHPSDRQASDRQCPSTLVSQSNQSGTSTFGGCHPSDRQASDR